MERLRLVKSCNLKLTLYFNLMYRYIYVVTDSEGICFFKWLSYDHFCLWFPRNKLWLSFLRGFTSVPAPPSWILWEHDRDWSVHDVGGFTPLGLCTSIAAEQPVSQSAPGARVSLLHLPRAGCVRVCVCNCVLHGPAATPPPTHKHTGKIKSRSRAVSFQSLPSFLSPCPRV